MALARRSTRDDLRQLAVTGWRAFVDDPVVRWFFPDDADFGDNGQAMFSWVLRRGHALDSLWCTDDGAAFARWTPPGRPEPDPVLIGDEPDPRDPDWRTARYGAYYVFSTANTPPEPHWYLNMLATHPDWQRRGLGVMLMREVFAIADSEGVGCYLETETEENVAYYRRHGFEVRTEWDLATDTEVDVSAGPHQWGMWRAPR